MGINFTLIGQMITFILFVGVTMKYIWPPMMKAMQERQKKIADGLEAAARGERSLELAKQKTAKMLKEARGESAGLIEQANHRSVQIVDTAKKQARDEGAKIVNNAKLEIDQMSRRARDGLRSEVSNLSILIASKILAKEIDAKAHDQLIQDLMSEIEHG